MKTKIVRGAQDIVARCRQNAALAEKLIERVQREIDRIPDVIQPVSDDAIDMEYLILGLQASMNDLRAIAKNIEDLLV